MITWKIMSKNKEYKVLPRASVKEVIESGIKALPCLFMPVIMMGGMLTGIFTPTEAGVVAVVYAFLVATFLNRKMNIHVLKKCMVNAAKSSAVVMFIVATTTALAAVSYTHLDVYKRQNQYLYYLVYNVSGSNGHVSYGSCVRAHVLINFHTD